VAWPYLRAGTPQAQWAKLMALVDFFLARGVSARDTFTGYPFLLLFTMTPPIELVGLALAAVLPFRSGRREAAVAALGWIWLAVPLVRIAWPRSNFYDANRHFLEYIGALALLAGSGLDLALGRVATWLARRHGFAVARRAARGLLVAVLVLVSWPVLQYHPYEPTYYNVFAGGLGGAQAGPLTRGYVEKMEFWAIDSEGDYWGFSYRNAIRDLNRLARPGETFYPCGVIAPLTRYQHVRADLSLAARERADYFIVVPRRPFCSSADLAYVGQHGKVLVEERRDGGLIYAVHRRRAG
jgi:hypothetical protein